MLYLVSLQTSQLYREELKKKKKKRGNAKALSLKHLVHTAAPAYM